MLSFRTMIGLAFLAILTGSHAAGPPPAAEPKAAGRNARQAGGAAAEYKLAGPYKVAFFRAEWTDAQRDRKVPVKVYYPEKAGEDDETLLPTILFSHGLGGSREGYAYLGRHWASHGYVSVHLEHAGSAADVWRGQDDRTAAMQQAAKDPDNAINRPRDVSFGIDQMARVHADKGPLQGRLDLERFAVAGHSFGAFTALAIAGELGTYVSEDRSLADPRVRAAIAMSAPVPPRRTDYNKVYGPISIPCLHMTGTLDESPIAFTKVADRRLPYDNIYKADQFLVNFINGDHAIFSGRQRRGAQAQKDAAFAELICMSTAAFLDAYLRENDDAKHWLLTGGLKAALAKEARVEQKEARKDPPRRPAPRE